MNVTFFACNNIEESWIASICAQGEREMEQWERDEDRDHEEQLARDAVADDEIELWPWYADAPHDVEEPEIIADASLLGFPVDITDEQFDDETPVEYYDDTDR